MAKALCRTTNKASSSTSAAIPRSYNLPEEVIDEILSKLPVKTLVRFESVSTFWQSKIKSPSFIKSHLNHAIARNPKSLIIGSSTGENNLITQHHLAFPKLDGHDLGLPYLKDAISPNSEMLLVGSFNGVVCVLVTDLSQNQFIYLWNPATKRSKQLRGLTIEGQDFLYYSVGFGYDQIAQDEKVVRVLDFADDLIRAEVFSVEENCWREIKVDQTFFLDHYKCDASIKGVLYWSASGHLVTFNLNNEVFNSEVLLPNLEEMKGTDGFIMEFRDSIALSVRHCHGTYKNEFSLWTLDNEVGKGAWSKKFTFDEFPMMNWVSAYLKTGEIIGKTVEGNMILCDRRNKQSKNVTFPFEASARTVFNYTQSLVSIRGSEQVK